MILIYLVLGLRTGERNKCFIGLMGASLLLGLAVLTRPNALLALIPFAVDTGLRGGSMRMRVMRVLLLHAPALL